MYNLKPPGMSSKMPEITVNIEVYCTRCGLELSHGVDVKPYRWGNPEAFHVEPCERCENEAYNRGYQNGKDDPPAV